MRRNQMFGGEEEENEINLTPMLDVVFIMLIFFIVTASFIKEAGIDVDRPDAPTAESQDDAERLHAENPKGSIVIQADEESTNETLVVVMEAAKQAGVPNVAISALKD